MNYNDEQILSVDDYQQIAKAYADALRKKGLKIVNIDDEIDGQLLSSLFQNLANVKSCLFSLGGFLNTSSFYSLNERQIKKLSIIFENQEVPAATSHPHDKTKCFLSFLSYELSLVNALIKVSEQSNFEREIKMMIDQRLNLLSSILSL